MNIYMLALRLVHIVAGIIWGGGALIMEFFIGRSIRRHRYIGQGVCSIPDGKTAHA